MRVLFCTAEIHPFSRVGGLAEFSGMLPVNMLASGIEVAVITPFYRQVNRNVAEIVPIENMQQLDVNIGSEVFKVSYHQSTLPETSIPVYFVECDTFFGRDGIYSNPNDKAGFADSHRRFGLFQRAILKFIEHRMFYPDILHLNDHHTSLLSALIKSREDELKDIKTVLTVHNAAYQLEAAEEFAFALGMSEKLFEPEGKYKRHEHINFLRAGICFADKIVAVSPNYAEEIKNGGGELSHGLWDILHKREDDFSGILNGIDDKVWDPKSDTLITENFGQKSLVKKLKNKEELLAKNGLDYSNLDVPTIGMITQLTDNKGFDLLTPVFDKLFTFDLHLVMLGTGDPKYHKLLESVKMRFPHKFGLNLTYSNEMAHQILAGSDFFLIPSRYEPCGQQQMQAMRYGTVPIVRATGGLADSVMNVSDDCSEGCGFTYNDYDSTQMLKAVWRAISAYKDKKSFKKIVLRAMKQDFSWRVTTDKYIEVYNQLMN